MSADDRETTANELVIIRRSGGGEEAAHHGGVWKIAYADFMTAMMAFFLVMWLINSSDKKVLTQVANYFNPLRLTDKSPAVKGVHDLGAGSDATAGDSGANEKDAQAKAKAKAKGKAKTDPKADPKAEPKADPKTEPTAESAHPKNPEETLFKDPYGVLEKLAAQADAAQPRSEIGRAKHAQHGGGEAFRDPFDPAFRLEARKDAPPSVQPAQNPDPKAEIAVQPGQKSDTAAEPAREKSEPPQAPKLRQEAVTPSPAPDAGMEAEIRARVAATLRSEATARKEAEEQARSGEKSQASNLEAQIKGALGNSLPGPLPNIDVTPTAEGLLISLTDDYDFGMFAIASAEPRPATVVVMEKIAKVLAGRSERLVVRGHTDGRPYKSQNYDNWRLSTARAHMAYYMLIRGGIDEKRFERVEGHADRGLRIAGDPEAAQNRRIEILLRKATP